MIAKLSEIVQSARGTIGSTTFRQDRGRTIISAKSIKSSTLPSGPTPQVRFLSQLRATFAAFSPTVQAAWRNTARLYNQRYLEGAGAPEDPWPFFMQTNLPRRFYNIAIITSPPAVPARAAIPEVEIDMFAPNQVNTRSTGELPGAGEFFLLEMSFPRSAAADRPYKWTVQRSRIDGPRVVTHIWFLNEPYYPGSQVTFSTRRVASDLVPSRRHLTPVVWPS